MKLNDLRLLVDCAFWQDFDQVVFVGPGQVAAKERLLKARLIQENPQQRNVVKITDAGERFIDKLLEIELVNVDGAPNV